MNYMNIYPCAISDGQGVRVSLYVSGCRNHCQGCHNKSAWNFKAGSYFDPQKTLDIILQYLDKDYISGLTLCGGEPMEKESQEDLCNLAEKVKAVFPNKTIWCYTGYLYEDLKEGGKQHFEYTDRLLAAIDVLIDGPFLLSQRDITDANRWRGSKNQRVIDIKRSLREGRPVSLAGIPNNNF